MRATFAALLITFLAAHSALCQDSPQPQSRPALVKADLSYFINSGLKLKSFTLEFAEQRAMDGTIVPVGRISYVLEFDRDVANYDLEALQKNLAPQNRRLHHIFFDDENVAINAGQVYDHRLFGEVSGIAGEAVRVVVEFLVDPKAPVQQARKLVVRPG